MKKIISVLLALLMLFSTATVAFAGDKTATPETTTTVPAGEDSEGGESEATPEDPKAPESAEDLLAMIEGMSWTEIKFALKVAKIAVKLVLVLDKLGFVDLTPIKNAILEFAWGMIKDYIDQSQAEETTTVADVTTEASSAA